MVASIVVLHIFLLLLPGFCTQKIKAKIATLKASSDLDRVTDALVYSLLNYASVILFGWLAGVKVPNVYDAVKADKIDLTSVGFTPGFILALFGVSLFCGTGYYERLAFRRRADELTCGPTCFMTSEEYG